MNGQGTKNLFGLTQEQFDYALHEQNQTFTARFGYWNSLLILNTILIAVFISMSTYNYNLSYSIIVTLSVVSSFLLLINFRITKKYLDNPKGEELSEEELKIPIEQLRIIWQNKGLRRRSYTIFFESICEIILVIQGLIIIYVSFREPLNNLINIVVT